jgi:hypothetical protein
MKIITYLFLFITITGCKSSDGYDSCLQPLKVLSVTEFNNGEIEYEVIGEIRTFSKGASDLELALEETLNLNSGNLNGCLVFEENFPECFGYFILDTRASLDVSEIKLGERSRVKFRRIKLKVPILETIRKQQNVEYLYLVKEVKVI